MITSGYRLKLGHSSCPQILYWNFEIYIIGSWKGSKTEIVLLSRNESPWHTICIAFNFFTLLSLKEMSLLHLHCLISSVLTFSIFIMLLGDKFLPGISSVNLPQKCVPERKNKFEILQMQHCFKYFNKAKGSHPKRTNWWKST